ncbi:hypothetical protein NDU88_001500 [Pleurodeles waltl]|uniref:Uncharacterized protein n=1 Tax=Pleurodeles waltl TaxID=8319 RepID=A0AAV7KWF4_PLEWA|nr:hypothetical protein NDU88_001500 [Pleurodeles waltl]
MALLVVERTVCHEEGQVKTGPKNWTDVNGHCGSRAVAEIVIVEARPLLGSSPWKPGRCWDHLHGSQAVAGIIAMEASPLLGSSPWTPGRCWDHRHGSWPIAGIIAMEAGPLLGSSPWKLARCWDSPRSQDQVSPSNDLLLGVFK